MNKKRVIIKYEKIKIYKYICTGIKLQLYLLQHVNHVIEYLNFLIINLGVKI